MEPTHKPKKSFAGYLCILLLFFFSLYRVLSAPIPQELTVRMSFGQAPEGILSQLFWGEDGALSAQNCVDGVREEDTVSFLLPQPADRLQMLRIDPSNTTEPYRIYDITFFLNDEAFFSLSAADIAKNAFPVNASFAQSKEELLVTPQNADSGLLIDSQALHQAALGAFARRKAGVLRERFFLTLLLCAALTAAFSFRKSLAGFFSSLFKKEASGRFDWFSPAACAVIGAALLSVTAISLFSALGMHPDEWDVKACLDYGMTHFLPPDMRDPAVAYTYSGYGYTKLENYTWYFFLAGKAALICRSMFYTLPYYRIPNLLLFLFMTFYFLRNIRKKKWIMVAFGICAQAWYIFAYTTADALDFVWAFLAICQLADSDSLLFAVTDGTGFSRKKIPGILLLGLLYGMILLGKPNYYSVLALTFFVLLFRLIRQKNKPQKRRLLLQYAAVLCAACLVWFLRAGFDLAYYGTDKAAVKEEMSIRYSDYDKNPSTPLEQQSPSYHMRSKGASLSDFFAENPEWFFMSYKSFCGLLQDNKTGIWYDIVMGILYATLFGGISFCTLYRTSCWDRLEWAAGTLLMAGGVIASIANSYLIDSQAQGRYLLPLVLIAAYLASKRPRLLQSPFYQALLLLAGILSAGYMGLSGVPLFL